MRSVLMVPLVLERLSVRVRLLVYMRLLVEIGLLVGMGSVLAGGERVWAMEIAPGEAMPQATKPREPQPREAEVSDLGSNNALPESLRAVFFPRPPDFAERAPAGERLTTRGHRDGGGDGGAGGAMPSLGYPINQAPIEVSSFGMRWSEARADWRMHTGIDLIVTEGTPVLAAAAGRVLLVDEVSGYGLTVVVDHGQGWQTLYAHLFEIAVQPGEQVERGQPLGRVGESGRASTPHLHFELRQRRGDRWIALDPAPILRPREPGAIVRRP
jgi:murein DD-endopeptidase MepM/ murein hydrolase activator NlpD